MGTLSFPNSRFNSLDTLYETHLTSYQSESALINPLPIVDHNIHPNKGCCGILKKSLEKIGAFLKANWKYILLYILAWGLVLACHAPVALTLTIWLGIGFGAGVIWGIFSANVLDKQNKYKHINSIWNLLNHGLMQLDPNGTRQLLLAAIIASISALIYAIPQTIGFIIGACIGNQISINTCYGIRLGEDAQYIIDPNLHKQKIAQLESTINLYQSVCNQIRLQQQLLLLNLEKNPSIKSNQDTTSEHSTEDTTTPTPKPEESAYLNVTFNIHSIIRYPIESNLVIPSNSLEAIVFIQNRILALTTQLQQLKETPDRIVEDLS